MTISIYALDIIDIVMPVVLLAPLIPYLFNFQTKTIIESAIVNKKTKNVLLSEYFLYCSFNGLSLATFRYLNLKFEILPFRLEHQPQDIF